MKKLIESNVDVPEFYDSNFQLPDKDLNTLYHEMMPCKYELNNTFSKGFKQIKRELKCLKQKQ